MENLNEREIFNISFKQYGNINYLENLVKCAYDNKIISARQGKEIDERYAYARGKYLIDYCATTKEEWKTYLDILEIRNNKDHEIRYAIDNYLMTLEPYSALEMILNGNMDDLINNSMEYYNQYKSRLNEKIDKIKELTKYEYVNNQAYKDGIDSISLKINSLKSKKSDYNLCMNTMSPLPDAPLRIHEKYIDDLLIEAGIISKFSEQARQNVLYDSFNEVSRHESICKLILFKYSMLSLHTEDSESLRMDTSIRNKINQESQYTSISIEEIDDILRHRGKGSIEFDSKELNYITNNFYPKITTGEKTVNKLLYMKIL